MIEIPEFHESLQPKEFLDFVFTTKNEDLEKNILLSVPCKESSKIDCDSILWDSKVSSTMSSYLPIFCDLVSNDENIIFDTPTYDDDGIIFDKP